MNPCSATKWPRHRHSSTRAVRWVGRSVLISHSRPPNGRQSGIPTGQRHCALKRSFPTAWRSFSDSPLSQSADRLNPRAGAEKDQRDFLRRGVLGHKRLILICTIKSAPGSALYWIAFGAANVQLNNMRSFILTLLLAGAAFPALLPDTIGAWKRGDATPAAAPDPKVWKEYGLQDAETAPYADGAKKFSITAFRFTDATGAMAAFDAIRPADARPVDLMGLASESAEDEFVAAGNYLLVFKGTRSSRRNSVTSWPPCPTTSIRPLPSLPATCRRAPAPTPSVTSWDRKASPASRHPSPPVPPVSISAPKGTRGLWLEGQRNYTDSIQLPDHGDGPQSLSRNSRKSPARWRNGPGRWWRWRSRQPARTMPSGCSPK